MSRAALSRAAARRILGSASIALCMLALALNSPGHISMDTSIQMHEAATGVAASWNPPFMSALLRWLGGDAFAAFELMLGNVVVAYGSLWVIAYCGLRRSTHAVVPDEERIAVWRVLLALVIIANPVIFLYVGILWKDVLMATLMLAFLALVLAASTTQGRLRSLFAAMAILALLPMPLTRQQGWFMLPLLLPLPVWLLASGSADRLGGLLRAGFTVLVTAVAMMGLAHAVAHSIRGGDGRDMSTGARAIMTYDVVGAIADGGEAGRRVSDRIGATPQMQALLAGEYSGARIDGIGKNPSSAAFLQGIKNDRMQAAWLGLIRENPGAWLRHRWDVFRWLLDTRNLDKCLPIHVGIAGMPAYLDALRIHQGIDARAHFLFVMSRSMEVPWYQHWFYALLLPLAMFFSWRSRSLGRARNVLLLEVLALIAYLASFFPTSIACDFRYLYPIIPSLSGVMLTLLLWPHAPVAGDSRTTVDAPAG